MNTRKRIEEKSSSRGWIVWRAIKRFRLLWGSTPHLATSYRIKKKAVKKTQKEKKKRLVLKKRNLSATFAARRTFKSADVIARAKKGNQFGTSYGKKGKRTEGGGTSALNLPYGSSPTLLRTRATGSKTRYIKKKKRGRSLPGP